MRSERPSSGSQVGAVTDEVFFAPLYSLRRIYRMTEHQPVRPTDERWAAVRLLLGVGQMTGAVAAGLVLVQFGVTALSLGLTLTTAALTSVSVLLFGSRRPRIGADNSRRPAVGTHHRRDTDGR